MIKRKNRLHAFYKKHGGDRLEKRWKDIRRDIKKEIDLSHNNHMRNLIGDIKEDPKPFWRYINSQKSDVQGIPPLETKDNGTAKTDLEKAEALNKQFSSVFTRTEYDSIP